MAVRNIWRRALRRFGRARRGAATVEFALVLLPFFFLTFGLAEISMVGFAQASLDYAVSETSRQIRTGQAQTNGVSQAQLKAQLCGNFSSFMLLSCDTDLYVDVDSFPSFVAAGGALASPIQDGAFDPSGFNYAPGGPSDIVVVRVFYRWKIITPMMQSFLANAGSERIVVSTMMFRNEPYS